MIRTRKCHGLMYYRICSDEKSPFCKSLFQSGVFFISFSVCLYLFVKKIACEKNTL